MLNQWKLANLVLLSLPLMSLPSTAAAATLAGLQTDVGPAVDALVRAEIEASVDATLTAVSSWKWIDTKTARKAMDPVVRDCFTVDCLSKAGKSVKADAGLRIRFSGESQIYDWTFEVFDLRDGALLQTRKGACELCGRAEVVREFENSLREVAVATKLPRAARSVVSKPPKEPRSAEPTPDEPEAVDDTTSSDRDPIADLVLLEISVEPADVLISVDGQEVGVGSATVSLESGPHELQFSREGFGGLKESFLVGAQTPRRSFMRVRLSRTDPEIVAAPVREGPIDRLGDQRAMYGALTTSLGAVLLVSGAYLNYIDGRPACSEGEFSNCPDLYATGGAAFVTTLSGAVLATGGIALLAWDVLAGDAEDATTTRVAPALLPGGAGIVFGTRF